MKRKILRILIPLLVITTVTKAQFKVTSGSTFFVKSGTPMIIDSLTLQPDADLTIHELLLTGSYNPLATSKGNGIKRVYEFSPALSFSGDIGIRYSNAELNGNIASKLKIVYDTGTGAIFSTGTILNTPQYLVQTFPAAISFTRISAADTVGIACSKAPKKPGGIKMLESAKPCSGDTRTFFIPAVANTDSYHWDVPASAAHIISGQGTPSVVVQFDTGFSTPIAIQVNAQNDCGTSAYSSKSISKNKNSLKVLSITPDDFAVICPGDTRTYTLYPVSGAISYAWAASPGINILSGQGTTSIAVEFTPAFTKTGFVSAAANNTCGVGAPKKEKATRGKKPAAPSPIVGPAYGVCEGNAIPYSVTKIVGLTYAWSFDSTNAIINFGQGVNEIQAKFLTGFSKGTLSVTAANGCGISGAKKLKITAIPAKPTIIDGPASVCSSQVNVSYSTPIVNGAVSYDWTAPSGATISDGITTSAANTMTTVANTVFINFGNKTGNVKVRASNNCGNTAVISKKVTVTNCGSPRITNELAGITLFPNPAHDQMNIMFYTGKAGSYDLRVIDMLGKEVLLQNGKAVEGNNETTINVSNLAAGVYQLLLLNESTKYKARFVVE